MAPIRAIRQSVGYLLRSSLSTPTKKWFIIVPMPGDIAIEAKFIVPVKNAKIVPSIFYGVILANRAMIGKL